MNMWSLFSYAVSNRPLPPTRYRFRAFYLTVFCLSFLAIISLITDQITQYTHASHYGVAEIRAIEQLDATRPVKRVEECRLVHHAEDKCAFVKAICPDEEAGLLSYLSLYYCNLQKAQAVAFAILSLWLALLFTTIGIAASDFFCINLSTIASLLGMSESMAGVTFLAFGNGSPDVFSTFAAMNSDSGSLAIGELVGAASFITAVVAGSMALVREFKVGKKTFVRDVGFFIVSASFAMIFLADGALQLWECCAMVGFYLFYVVIVIVWHWYLGQRRRRWERDAAARGQYLAMANEEVEASQQDQYDEDAPAGVRGYRDSEDFPALEEQLSPTIQTHPEIEVDEDGQQSIQLAAEMANGMRLMRPRGSRRSTITAIRPSLVGALEFRSILSSLQKSRGTKTQQICLRSHSDDPNFLPGQYDGATVEPCSDDDASIVINSARDTDEGPSWSSRILSADDMAVNKTPDSQASNVVNIPAIDIVAPPPHYSGFYLSSSGSDLGPASVSPISPLSRPPSDCLSWEPNPTSSHERKTRDTLSPSDAGYSGSKIHRNVPWIANKGPGNSANGSSGAGIRTMQLPPLQTSSSRDGLGCKPPLLLQYPTYNNTSGGNAIRTPKSASPLISDVSTPEPDPIELGLRNRGKPIYWWPYHYLPSPYTIGSTLFPTLCRWGEKNIWDKFVSVVSAPSIFLLAITLPVVESDSPEDNTQEIEINLFESNDSTLRSIIPILTPDSPVQNQAGLLACRRSSNSRDQSLESQARFSLHDTAAVCAATEPFHQHSDPAPMPSQQNSGGHEDTPAIKTAPSKDWNRWLVSIQIFTAPLFIIFTIWASNGEWGLRLLIKMALYSLTGSLTLFAILMFTTTPHEIPKYRSVLCFFGFIVSIAWISTIANEVVGVLKALGVILGISDAILGLTIFAIGNSLGDLVADITIARLGYPVMALSACFGGPMLNILLGIGLSGIYMTVHTANDKHANHPGKEVKYKAYPIEVSGTLIVSAITLLITLVGLLVVVPMNKWFMSRRIGWGLIILWTTSTVLNLGIEAGGVWKDAVEFG